MLFSPLVKPAISQVNAAAGFANGATMEEENEAEVEPSPARPPSRCRHRRRYLEPLSRCAAQVSHNPTRFYRPAVGFRARAMAGAKGARCPKRARPPTRFPPRFGALKGGCSRAERRRPTCPVWLSVFCRPSDVVTLSKRKYPNIGRGCGRSVLGWAQARLADPGAAASVGPETFREPFQPPQKHE